MKKLFSPAALSIAFVSLLGSANVLADRSVIIRTLDQVTVTTRVGNVIEIDRAYRYIRDTGSNIIYGKRSAARDWVLKPLGGNWYNIESLQRPGGCIYDSSGSDLAKYDTTCNDDFPRAEWKIEAANRGYKIINRKGRCMEFNERRMKLEAVTCEANALRQLFAIY